MKTTAMPASRLPWPSRSRLSARLADFVALAKPRVMLLAVFTAVVGLTIAPGNLDPLHVSCATQGLQAPHVALDERLRVKGRLGT